MKNLSTIARAIGLIVPAFVPALLAPATAAAQIVDLVDHNGFEACWSKAITKPQFLDLLHASIDGASGCIAQTSGSAAGIDYSACTNADCGGQIGCPVTVHAGTFSGDFGTGAFSGPGTADDISIPISYTYFGMSGNCTITISNITLTYTPWLYIAADGNSGDYMAYLTQQSAVTIDAYSADSPDLTCKALIVAGGSSFVSQAEAAGSALLQGTQVGETVCPLTP